MTRKKWLIKCHICRCKWQRESCLIEGQICRCSDKRLNLSMGSLYALTVSPLAVSADVRCEQVTLPICWFTKSAKRDSGMCACGGCERTEVVRGRERLREMETGTWVISMQECKYVNNMWYFHVTLTVFLSVLSGIFCTVFGSMLSLIICCFYLRV